MQFLHFIDYHFSVLAGNICHCWLSSFVLDFLVHISPLYEVVLAINRYNIVHRGWPELKHLSGPICERRTWYINNSNHNSLVTHMIYLLVASACVVAMQRNIPIRSSALGRDTCRHGRSKAKLLRSSSRCTWLAACSGLLIITQFPDNTPTLCNFMLRQFGAICPATLQIFRLNSFCTRGSDHSARSPAAGSFPSSENLWTLTGIYRSCNDHAHMEIFPDLPQIMPHYNMKRCNSFLKHTTSNSELATFPPFAEPVHQIWY